MSIAAIQFVFATAIRSAPQKLVILALASRISDDTGICFPGQVLIAEEATMSERQVRQHLAALEKDGRIKRYFALPSGDPTSDEYEIVGFMDWLREAKNLADSTIGGFPPVEEKRTRKSVQQPAEIRQVTVSVNSQ